MWIGVWFGNTLWLKNLAPLLLFRAQIWSWEREKTVWFFQKFQMISRWWCKCFPLELIQRVNSRRQGAIVRAWWSSHISFSGSKGSKLLCMEIWGSMHGFLELWRQRCTRTFSWWKLLRNIGQRCKNIVLGIKMIGDYSLMADTTNLIQDTNFLLNMSMN